MSRSVNILKLNCGLKSIVKTFSSKCTSAYKEKPDPDSIYNDYIGPPDKDSNIRSYVRCVTTNESASSALLREKRLEVEKWNQDFWCRHNQRFFEEKRDFIRLHKLSENDDASADKLSEFYKIFLDKNKKIHILYNLSWYFKNLEVLVLAFQVKVQNIWK